VACTKTGFLLTTGAVAMSESTGAVNIVWFETNLSHRFDSAKELYKEMIYLYYDFPVCKAT